MINQFLISKAMGKFVNYVRNEKGFILSLVLMILGIAFGDASVLMAEGVTVAPPAPEGGTAAEGHEGLQTQLGGQDASVTTLERGGETGDIIAEDIDEDIAKFRPDFSRLTRLPEKRQRKREKRIMLLSIIISMLPVSLVSRTLNIRSLQVKNV